MVRRVPPSLLLTAILLAAVLPGPAAAGHDGWSAKAMDAPPRPPILAADCRLGNPAASTAFSGWWEGHETYAFLVDPAAGGCGCELGVALRAVHMLLGLDPGDTPEVQVQLMTAVAQGGCLHPGTVLDFAVAWPLPPVPAPGYHEVVLPVTFSCAETVSPYFVAVAFLDDTADGDGIDLVGGGDATPCRTWNDWGNGWYDLVADIGFTRDLTLWADFDCCTAPVGASHPTWTRLKAGYLGERP